MADKAQLDKYSVEDVAGLLELLDRLKLSGVEVAFRGQSLDWPLVPEIGREPFLLQGKDGYDHWIDFEDNLLNSFKKYAHPFITSHPQSDWDWLFFARQYGLPTRLLDWSTNPLKGLFFAVQNLRYDDRDSVLWAIETHGWLETLENEKRSTLTDMHLVYPSHLNERIVAQDSCFTVFPLPASHGKFEPANEARLVRRTVPIAVPAKARGNLRIELATLGVAHRTIFPGLDGIVASIRQEHGEGWLRED